MSAADILREFIEPILQGWRIQFGRWMDGNREDRYAVIRPVGGIPVSLVREPQFTLTLISGTGDDASVVSLAADSVIEAMRETSGNAVFLQPGEPVYFATEDGRHILELAISAITT